MISIVELRLVARPSPVWPHGNAGTVGYALHLPVMVWSGVLGWRLVHDSPAAAA
ncbi:hypothetical protein ABGB07_15280 [Micromonosporaceae bacterium B7E4]